MNAPPASGPCTEALLVFARHPAPGTTKTRLIPALGAEGAAKLYTRVARHVVAQAHRVERPGLSHQVFIEPASEAARANDWLGHPFETHGQSSGNLGARMAAAFEQAFRRGATRAVVIGTDCPGLDATMIENAFALLRTRDAVLAPAEDGGYTLLGLARPFPEAFEGIPWSSAETAAATIARFDHHRLWYALLPELRDLDTPEDLDALRPVWPELLSAE